MPKKIIIVLVIVLLLCIGVFIGLPKIKNYINEQRIKNATIIVELRDNMEVEFNTKVKVSDFIKKINGKIIDDKVIKTTKLGKQKVNFYYINEEDIKIPYSYEIEVIDNTPPLIWLNESYSINTNYEGDLAKDIMCADDTDNKPDCKIIGNYNSKVPGVYALKYEATDKSGNKTVKDFNLKVREPVSGGASNSNTPVVRTDIKDVIANYKTDNTKIGIDVSRWQGDIDYQKVKEAGVEFAFIKVGGTLGINGDYYVDAKFKENIEGFNKVGIPVGVYIFTYAKTKKDAKNDALWMVKQIKGYKVDLPVVYDWENWSSYNDFELSLFNLTNNANIFFDTLEEKGYKGALYSSKNYLENVWLPVEREIWLAHYTSHTSYEGDFKYWQMCDNGLVDGISGNVDIDIMFN